MVWTTLRECHEPPGLLVRYLDFAYTRWEPPASFEGGSEHMLTRFWERVDTGGRDINDASLFTKGEELAPKGPPRASCIFGL
jgi:hypothetical protein